MLKSYPQIFFVNNNETLLKAQISSILMFLIKVRHLYWGSLVSYGIIPQQLVSNFSVGLLFLGIDVTQMCMSFISRF